MTAKAVQMQAATCDFEKRPGTLDDELQRKTCSGYRAASNKARLESEPITTSVAIKRSESVPILLSPCFEPCSRHISRPHYRSNSVELTV